MSTPRVISDVALDNSFQGDTIQTCIVSRDIHRTMAGMVKLGIGPWRLYEFGPETVSDMTYMGRPAHYKMKLALAFSGNMMWEIIESVTGPNIYEDFLRDHGEGIHHVAQGCNNLPYAERVAAYKARGLQLIQSGTWAGRVPYAYFASDGLISTTIEIFDIPADFVMPEPLEWYPARP
ncbi:VOC family protein [Methylibium sp.]|uniref:VOC family protein n=1 Tax=Methylibium sp. TaxID=2067992 RepID=UPI00286C3035|nr:VOC family protein [Methylibium sp.]